MSAPRNRARCPYCAAHWFAIALVLAAGGTVHPHAYGVGLHPGSERLS